MSNVSETLGKLKQVLKDNERYFRLGLTDVATYLNGDYGKQWRFQVRVFSGTVTNGQLDYEDQEWITQVRDLPHGATWQPTLGYEYIPHPNATILPGHKRLDRAVKETCPEAVAAIQEWERHKPQVERLGNAEVKDLEQLINFPEELGKFYDAWHGVRAALPDVMGRFKEARRLDARLTWSGPGATAYGWILEDAEKAADAVYSGIDSLLSALMNYLDLAVDVIQVVLEVARQRVGDVAEAGKMLLGMEPKDWKQVVGALITQLAKLNDAHAKRLSDGISDLTSVANAQFQLNQQFAALRAMLGSNTLEWPAPRAEVSQKWDSTYSN